MTGYDDIETDAELNFRLQRKAAKKNVTIAKRNLRLAIDEENDILITRRKQELLDARVARDPYLPKSHRRKYAA